MTAKTKSGNEIIIELPEKVEAKVEGSMIILKSGKEENKMDISNPQISVAIKDRSIIIASEKSTKKEKKLVFTYNAHIKNMIKGVVEGHRYILKICSGHFPMNVSVNNNQFMKKNFIGEKHPRTLNIKKGVTVKVEGDKITIESADIGLAGTVASDIEKLTRRPNFDPRIFQDGIYLIDKNGKEIK